MNFSFLDILNELKNLYIVMELDIAGSAQTSTNA